MNAFINVMAAMEAKKEQIKKELTIQSLVLQEFTIDPVKHAFLVKQIENEPYTSRRGRSSDGNWRCNLRNLWSKLTDQPLDNGYLPNLQLEGSNVSRERMVYKDQSFFGDLKLQLRKNLKELGFDKVYFNHFDYPDGDPEVKLKVPV